jgi:copper(I)-binding protein/mono/diheme cytochrome c family protein
MEPRIVLLRSYAASGLGSLIVFLAACSGLMPSVLEGRALYQANGCTSCHGPSGHGDGPLAATLPSSPADLRYPASFIRGAGESEIAKTLAEGVSVAGSVPQLHHTHHELSMPRFAHLSEHERRSIALYVISLRDKPRDN